MKEKLNSHHITLLIYMIQNGIGIFTIPNILASDFGTNGWLALLPLSLIATLNIYLISLVYRLGNGKSIFEILEHSFPKFLLFPMYAFLVVVWSLFGCMVGKLYILIFQMMSFPTTNPIKFKFLLDILIFLLLIKGIYNISKAASLIFYLLIWMVALELFFIHEFKWIRFTHFIFQGETHFLKGTFDVYFSFLGYEISLLLLPYISRKTKVFKAVFFGHGMLTLVYLSICILCFGFYSFGQLKQLKFPLIDLLAYIELPFIQRIDSLLFTLFLTSVLITTTMYFWASQEVLKRIFPNVKEKTFGFFLVIGTFSISFIPQILREVEKWLAYLSYLVMAIAFVLPLLGLIVLLFQRLRRKESV